MRQIQCHPLVLAAVIALGMPSSAATASAATKPTAVVIHKRVVDDCPRSELIVTNTYPGSISISDEPDDCDDGVANLHRWRLTEDGTTAAQVTQEGRIRFGADLVIGGPGAGEAGLEISSPDTAQGDGRFNVRSTNGEIKTRGRMLPIYSFSAPPHNVRYKKGTPIHLEIEYEPSAAADSAWIELKISYQGKDYRSGKLRMLHGSAGVGGYLNALWRAGDGELVRAKWSNIQFVSGIGADPAKQSGALQNSTQPDSR